LRGVR